MYLNWIFKYLVLGCTDTIVVLTLPMMYGFLPLIEDPPIAEKIDALGILYPSKAVPVMCPIANTAYVCSIYLIVLLTVERYLVICKQSYDWNLKKTKMSSFCIILCCIIYCIPMCWGNSWEKHPFKSGNYTISVYEHGDSSSWFIVYDTIVAMIFRLIIPVPFLLVLNFLIIKEVKLVEIIKNCHCT